MIDVTYRLPHPVMQIIGLACVPIPDLPDDAAPWLRQKPVAAAIMTISQRDDGHIQLTATRMSDAHPQEFPLPWLVEQSLIAGAPTLISGEDSAILSADAADRRWCAEPKTAALLRDSGRVIDPGISWSDGHAADERTLCRRLRIPVIDNRPDDNARHWSRSTAAALEERALGAAISRTMLWFNLESFRAGEPGLFYEPMLALRQWLADQKDAAPQLYGWITSKPVMRAVSFEQEFRKDLARRQAGEESEWPEFRAGLYHT